ncbi:MraY family glycosyltransferase [Emcibacter sp. SYSU 3D8]|uniref:glycosyltransferase family 4 protein n=1 Tax=Emcibacter sp. SYSU 3D8 TaxID=3133969 RepID=UPI0031FEB656
MPVDDHVVLWAIPLVSLLGGVLIGIFFGLKASTIGGRLGIIDRPDGNRKIHGSPTPLVGGVALFVSLAFGMVVDLFADHEIIQPRLWIFLVCAIFFGLGFLDDRSHLNPWGRLWVGLLTLAAATGIDPALRISTLNFSDLLVTLQLGLLSVPFTIFTLLCLKHASNMADGMNGLFLGMSVIWIVLLLPWFNRDTLALMLPVIGTLGVMLLFNLRGRLFTGDSGVYMLTALIGFAAVQAYTDAAGQLDAAYFASVFLIPVIDMGRVMLTRKANGKALFTPDRNHLHHWLYAMSGNHGIAVASYWGLCALPALHLAIGLPTTIVVLLQLGLYTGALAWRRMLQSRYSDL